MSKTVSINKNMYIPVEFLISSKQNPHILNESAFHIRSPALHNRDGAENCHPVHRAVSRCFLHPHAQIQVHNLTPNLMMTHYQPRANCQPSHTRLVSEKSCGFVEVRWGGCHYQTATTAEQIHSGICSSTSLPSRRHSRNQLQSKASSIIHHSMEINLTLFYVVVLLFCFCFQPYRSFEENAYICIL